MSPCIVWNRVAREVPFRVVVFSMTATSTVIGRKTSKHFEEMANLASRQCVIIRLMTQSGQPRDGDSLSRTCLAPRRHTVGAEAGTSLCSQRANEAQP